MTPACPVRFTIQDGIRVIADRSLIRIVLANLLENAWKFTAHRDGAVIEFATAATATAGEDGGVCCCVRDNGAGFDPAYAGKLFQPFERLHDAAEFPGTGIGLASVARIIERHGGRDGPTAPSATAPPSTSPSPQNPPSMKRRGFGGAAVTCTARCLPGGVVPRRGHGGASAAVACRRAAASIWRVRLTASSAAASWPRLARRCAAKS